MLKSSILADCPSPGTAKRRLCLAACVSCFLLPTSAMVARIPPRASPFALRTLRDVAVAEDALWSLTTALRPLAEFGIRPAPNQLSSLTASLMESVEGLPDRLRAVESFASDGQTAITTTLVQAGEPEGLQSMQRKATLLQQQVEEQRILISLIEGRDQDSETSAREIFEQIDANGDGKLELEEFEGAARSLLTFREEGAQEGALKAELRARFAQADTDGNGTLSFEEFVVMLRELKGNALGPLRAVFQEGLEQLLDVTLQLTALSLSSELTARNGRAKELSCLVDEWCELEGRARIIESSLQLAPEECDVDEKMSACASAEELLRDVAQLAANISVGEQMTEPSPISVRRIARQLSFAFSSFKSSLAFCYRGLQLMCRDIAEVASLVPKLWRERSLSVDDLKLIKRTGVDVVMLIPYAIVMIVPLTPPGHVFAFSLLNRCFPGAMPSAFTEKRQGIFEVYTRLAAQAQERSRLGASLRAASWRKRFFLKIPVMIRKRLRAQPRAPPT